MSTPASKVNALGVGSSPKQVTDWFQQQLLAALADPLFNVPKAFETWMVDRVAISGLNVPIGQIVGFSQFTAQYDRVDTSETTTSTLYDDLSTVGPQIDGLPTGQYVLLYGTEANVSSSSDTAFMSPNIGGVTPENTFAAKTGSTAFTSIASASLATVDVPNTTIKMQYAISPAGTATFVTRWLLIIRYANA